MRMTLASDGLKQKSKKGPDEYSKSGWHRRSPLKKRKKSEPRLDQTPIGAYDDEGFIRVTNGAKPSLPESPQPEHQTKNRYSPLQEQRDDIRATTTTSKVARDETATSNEETPPKTTTMHQKTEDPAAVSFELNKTDFPPMVGNSFDQHSKMARDVIEPQVQRSFPTAAGRITEKIMEKDIEDIMRIMEDPDTFQHHINDAAKALGVDPMMTITEEENEIPLSMTAAVKQL